MNVNGAGIRTSGTAGIRFQGYAFTDAFTFILNGSIISSSKYTINNNVLIYKFNDPNRTEIY